MQPEIEEMTVRDALMSILIQLANVIDVIDDASDEAEEEGRNVNDQLG